MSASLPTPGEGCRLLVIVNNFPPDRGGGAAVFGDLCYALAERGFQVTARCAYPYYPEWRDKSGRNSWKVWHYRERGVSVERYGLYIPRNPTSVVPRLLHEMSLFLSLLRSVPASRQFDAIMVICPAISSVAIGGLIRLLFRRPLWLNVQDLAADAASGVGLVRTSWVVRLIKAIQHRLFNAADVWSTISPVMLERIAPTRRRGQPLHLLPNWMDADLAAEITRWRLSNTGVVRPRRPLRLVYGGNLGLKQNLLEVLRVLQRTSAEFSFAIHGDGAQAEAIREWIAATRDGRFRLGPFLSAGDFARELCQADYYVITEGRDIGGSFMPSKLMPGLAAGVPVLAVSDAVSPLGTEVLQSRPGPWFSWDQLDQLVNFVAGEAHDAQQYETWSANALKRAEAFDRNTIIDQFAAALAKLAGGMTGKTV